MKLSKQIASFDVMTFSFSQRMVQEWNKAPQEVAHATSPTCVKQFQDKLDKFWQRNRH